MKAFVIACTTLGLLVLSLFGSSLWLTNRVQALSDAAASLSSLSIEEREKEMDALYERWERERLAFVVFVHKADLVALEEALTRARAAAKIKSDSEYLIAVAEMQAELVHLKTHVGLHIEGIF